MIRMSDKKGYTVNPFGAVRPALDTYVAHRKVGIVSTTHGSRLTNHEIIDYMHAPQPRQAFGGFSDAIMSILMN